MKISDPFQPASIISLASNTRGGGQLQIGQILNAIVERQINANTILLRINNQLLEVNTTLKLTEKQPLLLEVIEKKGDQTRLRLLAPISQGKPAQWQVGQILNAKVEKQINASTVLLRIENKLLEVQTSLRLPANKDLRVEVTVSGDQTRLRLLPGDARDQVIASRIRTMLPQQAPLGLTIKLLTSFLTQPDASTLSPRVLQILNLLASTIPAPSSLTHPDHLKRALLDSGLFLESSLSRKLDRKNLPDLSSDLKAILMRLRAALQGNEVSSASQDNMKSLIESALARIQINQLSSVPLDNQTTPLLAELPIRNGDNIDILRLHIEKDPSAQDDNAQPGSWSIWLTLDITSLGPLYVQLKLKNNTISTLVWAERKETLLLVENNIKKLQESFVNEGLEVLSINCLQGRPPHPSSLPLKLRLLDTSA